MTQAELDRAVAAVDTQLQDLESQTRSLCSTAASELEQLNAEFVRFSVENVSCFEHQLESRLQDLRIQKAELQQRVDDEKARLNRLQLELTESMELLQNARERALSEVHHCKHVEEPSNSQAEEIKVHEQQEPVKVEQLQQKIDKTGSQINLDQDPHQRAVIEHPCGVTPSSDKRRGLKPTVLKALNQANRAPSLTAPTPASAQYSSNPVTQLLSDSFLQFEFVKPQTKRIAQPKPPANPDFSSKSTMPPEPKRVRFMLQTPSDSESEAAMVLKLKPKRK